MEDIRSSFNSYIKSDFESAGRFDASKFNKSFEQQKESTKQKQLIDEQKLF